MDSAAGSPLRVIAGGASSSRRAPRRDGRLRPLLGVGRWPAACERAREDLRELLPARFRGVLALLLVLLEDMERGRRVFSCLAASTLAERLHLADPKGRHARENIRRRVRTAERLGLLRTWVGEGERGRGAWHGIDTSRYVVLPFLAELEALPLERRRTMLAERHVAEALQAHAADLQARELAAAGVGAASAPIAAPGAAGELEAGLAELGELEAPAGALATPAAVRSDSPAVGRGLGGESGISDSDASDRPSDLCPPTAEGAAAGASGGGGSVGEGGPSAPAGASSSPSSARPASSSPAAPALELGGARPVGTGSCEARPGDAARAAAERARLPHAAPSETSNDVGGSPCPVRNVGEALERLRALLGELEDERRRLETATPASRPWRTRAEEAELEQLSRAAAERGREVRELRELVLAARHAERLAYRRERERERRGVEFDAATAAAELERENLAELLAGLGELERARARRVVAAAAAERGLEPPPSIRAALAAYRAELAPFLELARARRGNA